MGLRIDGCLVWLLAHTRARLGFAPQQFLIGAVALAAMGAFIGMVLATGTSLALSGLMNDPCLFKPGMNLMSFASSAVSKSNLFMNEKRPYRLRYGRC